MVQRQLIIAILSLMVTLAFAFCRQKARPSAQTTIRQPGKDSTSTFQIPSVDSSLDSGKSFIPTGWVLVDSVSGDLNGDGFPDLAAVIESIDSIYERGRLVSATRKTQPKILLLFLRNKNKDYRLVAQQNEFLLRRQEDNTHSEPSLRLTMNQGALSISYSLDHDYPRYEFKYKAGEFYLSKFTITGAHGRWESNDSIDFETGYYNLRSTAINDDKLIKVRKGHLSHQKPIRLKDISLPSRNELAIGYSL